MPSEKITLQIEAKDNATKVVKELDKQIKALQKQKAEIPVDADTSDAQKKLTDLNEEIEKLQSEKVEIQAEANVSAALAALDDVAAEAKKAEAAAEALGRALGPELAAGADLDRIVGEFRQMGLSLDDVTAHADRLGNKLREIGTTSTGGIESAFRRARGSVDDLGRSAGSSRSVLANMVGNTTQDLGALTGIAGSAGVAIGQMGEYMTDAAGEGEKLGSVLGSFAKVAVPIAIIATAMEAVKSIQERFAESSERTAEAVDVVSDAFASGESAIDAYGDHLKDTEGVILDVHRSQSGLENVLAGMEQHWATSGIGIKVFNDLMGISSEETKNLTPLLNKAGIELDNWLKLVKGEAGSLDDFAGALERTTLTESEQADLLEELRQSQDDYNTGLRNGAEMADFFGTKLESVVDVAERWAKANKPVEDMPRTWLAAANAARRLKAGLDPTARQWEALSVLANQYGIDVETVLNRAEGEVQQFNDAIAQGIADQEAAFKSGVDFVQGIVDVVNDEIIAISEANTELADMASSFNTMARNEDAIQAAFDLKNVGIETLGQITDINEAIRDLGTFIEEEGVPDIFDPNDVDAGPFLDRISALRGPIQDRIAQAFAAGGMGKAQQTADAYVKQITESMRGRLTEGQVRELLGLTDLTATLQIAVDQASVNEALDMLNTLTGLRGVTPWSAAVELALKTGELSPEAANVLIAKELQGLGVDVPTSLLGPDDASKADAVNEANTWLTTHKPDMGVEMADPSLSTRYNVLNRANEWFRGHPASMPVVPVLQTGMFGSLKNALGGLFNDAGSPSVPSPGGIAGERRPEIVDDRYLVVGPTYVPPGSKVTSGAKTARILRNRSIRSLKRYDSGGAVPMMAGPVTVNFNGVGTIGNRYDLMRAVKRANLDKIRLQGTRG